MYNIPCCCDWRGQWRSGNLTHQSPCPLPACPQICIPLPRLVLRGLLRTLECQLKLPTFHSTVLMVNEGKKHTPNLQSQRSSRDHVGSIKQEGRRGELESGAWIRVPIWPIIIYTYASITWSLWVPTSTSELRECIKHSIKSSFQVPDSVAPKFQALEHLSGKFELPSRGTEAPHDQAQTSHTEVSKSHIRSNSFSICFYKNQGQCCPHLLGMLPLGYGQGAQETLRKPSKKDTSLLDMGKGYFTCQ